MKTLQIGKLLETLSEDVDYVAGFAHCVEVDCWGAVGDEVFALGCAPFGADLVDFVSVVACFGYLLGEFERDVEGESFGKDADLLECGDRFQSRDDRDGDSGCAAFVHKVVVHLVVEEHLGDDVVGAGVDFLLEVGDVGFDVRCLEVLFGVGADADTEVPFVSFKTPASSVGAAALVAADAFHQFACVSVAAWSRGETFLSCHAVASEGNDVVYSEEGHIVKPALYFLYGVAAADEVGNDFYVIFRHDRSTYGGLADAVAYHMPAEASVCFFPELEFVPVTGDVDIFRLELHEWSDAFKKLVLCDASERRNYFDRREGLRALGQDFGYFHSVVIISAGG